MAVSYEWRFEELDEYDDIIDITLCADRLKELLDIGVDPDKIYKLVLVRFADDIIGCCNQTYAYINSDMKLPERFSISYKEYDGTKVPKKYIQELERNQNRLLKEWCV